MLAAFVVGQVSRKRPAAQSDNRKSPDDEANRAVRTAQVMPQMRREPRQNRSDAEKTEEGCCDQAPEAPPERRG